MANELPLPSQSCSHRGGGPQFSVCHSQGSGLVSASQHPNVCWRPVLPCLGSEVSWLKTWEVESWCIPQMRGQGRGSLGFSFACTIKWERRHQNPSLSAANSTLFHSIHSIPFPLPHPFYPFSSISFHPLGSIPLDEHLLCARQCSKY